jgi:hypothetical protein
MSEEEKKPFFDPNGLYRMKNLVGALSTILGGGIAGMFMGLLLVGIVLIYFDESGNGYNILLEFLGSIEIDVGLAILLGSTIISGGILLSGIRKV